MNFAGRIKSWFRRAERPLHLQYGILGERAAKKLLKRQGLKFLTANFRSDRGEVDLVFRDADCLVFVEVKTRRGDEFGRPIEAIGREKQLRVSKGGLAWLRWLDNPDIVFRFDVVEVLWSDEAEPRCELIQDAFELSQPYIY